MFYNAQHVNKFITGDIDELIYFAEARNSLQFEMLLSEIHVADINCHESITDLVLVTGPSSSGKTTFSNLLAGKLRNDGYNCTVISLDNYYHDRDHLLEEALKAGKTPKDKMDIDFECIEAFNTERFKLDMNSFIAGNPVRMPVYDFNTGKSLESDKVLTPTEKDMIIVEGIQSLNPLLIEGIDFHRVFRVYICPFDYYQGSFHGESLTVNPKQIRFMRRAIRDSIHRNSPLSLTISMWDGVREGEEKYIKPMKQYADFFFNSSFEYEIAYLKYKILPLYEELSDEDKLKFSRILSPEKLAPFIPVGKLNLPADSIFREFYME
ncbi:MAG: nucleoside kinase [Clostridia bacterium]|nr:nucleoside kinase [Clostridia bacterium]